MIICLDDSSRTRRCFEIYVERPKWPPIPPEDPFHHDLVIEDPSWWRTAFAVDAIDQVAKELGGDFGAQLSQVAAVGLESLQAQLPEGIQLELPNRASSLA